ncbi:hypothetical protein BD770DRAFT_376365 [Pilaira anomala]|nr:hypothetical protein BD770DRAFT_376365 [Pilaira anomala]
MSNNPKSFYNQTDYNSGRSGSGGGGSSRASAAVIHKPDEVSAADLLPPPPYSPDPTRKSSESNRTYGSTEQQHGLLSQQAQLPFSQKKASAPALTSPNYHQSQQEPVSIPITYERLPPSSSSSPRRRSNGDPGCCRKWCKYLFAAILIWLVLLMYSDQIGLTPPPSSGHSPTHMCSSNAVAWEELPRMIDFERNVEVVLSGTVSSGRIVVNPIEARHGGTIFSEVQFKPNDLDQDMTFDVEQRGDTTFLKIQMPKELNDEDCVHLNMEIRLPYSADNVRIVASSNVDVLVHPFVKDVSSVDIQTANGHIELDRWSGETIRLVTSHRDIKIGQIIAGNSIYIENSNAAIYINENSEAKHRIDIRNANGLIEALGRLVADDNIKIQTSNELVQLEHLVADDIFVENANKPVRIKVVESKVQVVVKTSNAPIDLYVAEEKNIRVVVSTSSAPVNLHMVINLIYHHQSV